MQKVTNVTPPQATPSHHFPSISPQVSNTCLEISIIVHEFTMRAVSPEDAEPVCVNE